MFPRDVTMHIHVALMPRQGSVSQSAGGAFLSGLCWPKWDKICMLAEREVHVAGERAVEALAELNDTAVEPFLGAADSLLASSPDARTAIARALAKLSGLSAMQARKLSCGLESLWGCHHTAPLAGAGHLISCQIRPPHQCLLGPTAVQRSHRSAAETNARLHASPLTIP